MINIESNRIANTAHVRDWISAMEDALRDSANGLVEVPPRNYLDRGPNTLGFKSLKCKSAEGL